MSGKPIARLYRPTPRNIAFLAERLRRGELVGVPTETVYGLAANALDAAACANIFKAKGRPGTDPLIVHLASPDELDQVCAPNEPALALAEAFWPGPLTLVLPKRACIPGVVTAGRHSVAVRLPSHPVFRRLIRATGRPLAAPSANPFGYISPTTAEHVRQGLGTKVRYILDGGAATIGLESTIVDLRDAAKPAILRPGAVTQSELEAVLRRPVAAPRSAASGASARQAQLAPGLLARHYSPRTRLLLHAQLPAEPAAPPQEAWVYLRKPSHGRARNVFWLDERGNLRGVAQRLFATLRKLDGMGFKAIHAELAPEDGLGQAINDRLRRAAAR